MEWVCIHGIKVDDDEDGIGCEECLLIGKSPTYDPNCTVQDLAEILCDKPIVVVVVGLA
jgi:hypothetical protein